MILAPTLNDVQVIEENETKLIFDLANINVTYAKTMRDVMFTQIPTMAINEIHIIKNTTSIPYELIAQRIENIPIRADPTKYNYEDKIRFDLHKRADNGIMAYHMLTTVKSGDLKWIQESDENSDSPKPADAKPADDNYVILKLLPTQELHMICYAVKGTGQFHNKFSPISNLTYIKLSEIPALMTLDRLTAYSDLTRKIQSEEVTINDLSVLYPITSYRFTMETKGQRPPLIVLEETLLIVNQLMQTPYRQRRGLLGYLY